MAEEAPFTPEESAQLVRLLKKVQASKYWLPDLATYQEMQRTVSRWCFELVVIDLATGVPKVLLSRYGGEGVPQHHNLFHIGGGFEKFFEDEAQTIDRIAQHELGVGVEYLGLLGHHKWTVGEHPWGGRIMSLYALCKPQGNIEIRESRRFFTRAEMLALGPTDMDPKHPHRKFINEYLGVLESGKTVAPVKLGV